MRFCKKVFALVIALAISLCFIGCIQPGESEIYEIYLDGNDNIIVRYDDDTNINIGNLYAVSDSLDTNGGKALLLMSAPGIEDIYLNNKGELIIVIKNNVLINLGLVKVLENGGEETGGEETGGDETVGNENDGGDQSQTENKQAYKAEFIETIETIKNSTNFTSEVYTIDKNGALTLTMYYKTSADGFYFRNANMNVKYYISPSGYVKWSEYKPTITITKETYEKNKRAGDSTYGLYCGDSISIILSSYAKIKDNSNLNNFSKEGDIVKYEDSNVSHTNSNLIYDISASTENGALIIKLDLHIQNITYLYMIHNVGTTIIY